VIRHRVNLNADLSRQLELPFEPGGAGAGSGSGAGAGAAIGSGFDAAGFLAGALRFGAAFLAFFFGAAFFFADFTSFFFLLAGTAFFFFADFFFAFDFFAMIDLPILCYWIEVECALAVLGPGDRSVDGRNTYGRNR
jgi:hypothetical protein